MTKKIILFEPNKTYSYPLWFWKIFEEFIYYKGFDSPDSADFTEWLAQYGIHRTIKFNFDDYTQLFHKRHKTLEYVIFDNEESYIETLLKFS